MVSLGKCSGNCDSGNGLSIRICVPSKMLVKHISCDYKCEFNSATYNSNEKWNYK